MAKEVEIYILALIIFAVLAVGYYGLLPKVEKVCQISNGDFFSVCCVEGVAIVDCRNKPYLGQGENIFVRAKLSDLAKNQLGPNVTSYYVCGWSDLTDDGRKRASSFMDGNGGCSASISTKDYKEVAFSGYVPDPKDRTKISLLRLKVFPFINVGSEEEILAKLGMVPYIMNIEMNVGKIQITSMLSSDQVEFVQNFLQQSLRDEFKPTSLSFDSIKIPNRVRYVAIWKVGTTEFISAYNISSVTAKLNSVSITVNTPEMKGLTPVTALSYASSYFKEVRTMKCEKGNAVFCESFWVEPNGDKRGVFVIDSIKASSGNVGLVHTCIIPKGSEVYNLNSCFKRG